MSRILLFAAFSGSIWSIGCQAPKSYYQSNASDPWIALESSPCVTDCPVYALTIYHNGYTTLTSERFMPFLGQYERQLNTRQIKHLQQVLETIDFENLQEDYPDGRLDQPIISLQILEGEWEKRISGRENRPESILLLEQVLFEICTSKGWSPKDGHLAKLPHKAIPAEIIVEFKPGTRVEHWKRQLTSAHVQLVKSLSPDDTHWLVAYDPEQVLPNSMLQWILETPQVKHAEFNRVVFQ